MFTEGEEGVFQQIVTKLQGPYSFCFDTFGVSLAKSNVGPSDTFGVKLKFGTPLRAHVRAHTRGKLRACFHAHYAQEKSRVVFRLTFSANSSYEVRAFEAIPSRPT